MDEFRDNFIALVVWQLVMAFVITDSHHIKDGELLVFVKIVEIIVFLLVPLMFLHRYENKPPADDE